MQRYTYSRNNKSTKPLTPCDIYSALTNGGPPSYGGMLSSGTSTSVSAPYITYSYTNVSINSQR